MAKVRGAIIVDTERCKGCNLCVIACPTDVISLNEQVNGKGFNPAYPANHDSCTGCMNCSMVCPDMCITVYRYKPAKVTV
jgi:2-oxoglutarate ferredoxin oxidoreductase subunit delta